MSSADDISDQPKRQADRDRDYRARLLAANKPLVEQKLAEKKPPSGRTTLTTGTSGGHQAPSSGASARYQALSTLIPGPFSTGIVSTAQTAPAAA